MVVDAGGGTHGYCRSCDTGVVVSESLRIGGDSLTNLLSVVIRRKKRPRYWSANGREN